MTRVRLTRPHTHAGKPFTPGERIEVDAATAAWLFEHNVAALDAKAERKPPKPDPEPKSESPKEPKP
jgi:hypothetical protein